MRKPERYGLGKLSSREIARLQNYLRELLKAKQEGVKVEGYFIWTLKDNFEWAEGFHPRFGIIYVDFETQNRIIKASGLWYKNFLAAIEE